MSLICGVPKCINLHKLWQWMQTTGSVSRLLDGPQKVCQSTAPARTICRLQGQMGVRTVRCRIYQRAQTSEATYLLNEEKQRGNVNARASQISVSS